MLKETPAAGRISSSAGVSDVDDARSIDLLPSDTHLTLFEREVSKGDHEAACAGVRSCLAEARRAYDSC